MASEPLFTFNFAIVVVMEVTLSLYENSTIDVCSDRKLSELVCSYHVVLLPEDPRKLWVSLDRLNNSCFMSQENGVRSVSLRNSSVDPSHRLLSLLSVNLSQKNHVEQTRSFIIRTK